MSAGTRCASSIASGNAIYMPFNPQNERVLQVSAHDF